MTLSIWEFEYVFVFMFMDVWMYVCLWFMLRATALSFSHNDILFILTVWTATDC